ncbi:MAG: dephospho-CoA kinase [Brachymonas sp.]
MQVQVRMPRIGLTGGIGSGKSTVAAMLHDLGAAIVDADAIARSVADQGGAAVPALHARYGDALVHSSAGLNRAAMRDLVFQEPQARQELETLLRPFILQGIADAVQLAERQADTQAVVLDIPLLVENLAQWRPHIDALWVVDCPPELQIARVLARPSSQGWSLAQVQGVLAAQASREQRLAAADVVLDNGAAVSLDALRAQVQQQWVAITRRQ